MKTRKIVLLKSTIESAAEVSVGGATHVAYKMNKRPHGIALIISNTTFPTSTGLENRNGGKEDEKKVKDLFEKLHYNVVLLTDLSAKQIENAFHIVTGHNGMSFQGLKTGIDKKELDKLKDCSVEADNDSFVCCLMSHGDRGVVSGVDGKKFTISDLRNILCKCKLLKKKPKMVFIQACRGDKILHRDGDKKKINDILISYATKEDYASFRTDDGSWFMRAVCSVFEKGYIKKDVQSMLEDVHEEVGKMRGTFENKNVRQQTSDEIDMGSWKVYFDLKEPEST